MTRFIMHGCNGHMGQVITGIVAQDPDAEIVAGIDLVDNRDNGYPVFTNIWDCDVEADALLLVTPYYNKATQNGLIAHYKAIAESVSLPIILYNVPSRTGCNILPETAAYLGKNVENIVAIKEASGNISQVAKLKALAGDSLDIYSGNDDQVIPLLSLGGIGVISVLSNVAPKFTHDMVMKYLEGDHETALNMQLEALPLIDALFCEVNPIPVKAAMNLMGKEVGPLRAPLTVMEDAHQQKLAQVMKDFGIELA